MSVTHVFAVAIENYQNTAITPVRYAENDAKAFVSAWQQLGADPADCVTLLSASATLASVRSRLKRFLSSIPREDRVVVFYAGHGAAFDDHSYVTVHDTQLGDIKSTSVSLSDILTELRKCKSHQALLFIDSCHSGLPISSGMRSIYTHFSENELVEFCKDSKYRVAFASCEVTESSMSHSSLGHGIWTHCLVRALAGDAKHALEKNALITGQSLQGYLADEVPKLVRRLTTGVETQTPCLFGNYTKEFIVADLSNVLNAKAKKNAGDNTANFIKSASIRGESYGQVKKLRGFTKGYHVPDGHYDATANFVRKIGDSDVSEHATIIHDELKESFAFKRSDIDYLTDVGTTTIITPDFDVRVWIEQDSDDPGAYVITTEVENFRRPAILDSQEFYDVFSKYCDTVVVGLARDVSLSDLIDKLEGQPKLRPHLKYDPGNSWLTLDIPGVTGQIRVTAKQVIVSAPQKRNLRELITGAQKTITAIAASNFQPLLEAK